MNTAQAAKSIGLTPRLFLLRAARRGMQPQHRAGKTHRLGIWSPEQIADIAQKLPAGRPKEKKE